jgi:hypothetical protein
MAKFGLPLKTYAVNFKLARDATYWQRRKRLARATSDEAVGLIWARTTSTIVMRSRRSTEDLLITLVYKAELQDRDRVLLTDITDQENARFGLDEEDVLDILLPPMKTPIEPASGDGLEEA